MDSSLKNKEGTKYKWTQPNADIEEKSRCRVKDNHNNHVPETIPEISVKGRSVIFFKVSK